MNAIVWTTGEALQPPPDFEKKLSTALRGRVQRIFVFGSYGTEAFRPGSDIDLILVCETKRPFVERPRLFEDLYNIYPRLDVLIYTEKELTQQLSEPTGFWASVKAGLRELPVAPEEAK